MGQEEHKRSHRWLSASAPGRSRARPGRRRWGAKRAPSAEGAGAAAGLELAGTARASIRRRAGCVADRAGSAEVDALASAVPAAPLRREIHGRRFGSKRGGGGGGKCRGCGFWSSVRVVWLRMSRCFLSRWIVCLSNGIWVWLLLSRLMGVFWLRLSLVLGVLRDPASQVSLMSTSLGLHQLPCL